MTPKRLITGLLLAFVVVSVVFLIVKENRGRANGSGAASPTTGGAANKVVAYYFHGTQRCPTCRKIEAYTREALDTAFAAELAAGEIEWRAVNIEDGGNEHFVTDYQITGKTVVLVEVRGGQQTRFKKLEQTWDYVGDKSQFVQYIQDQTRDYLAAL